MVVDAVPFIYYNKSVQNTTLLFFIFGGFMITNLVFKRTVNVEGSTRTEMKIIEVMLPDLKSSEGWTLVSSADHVEVNEIPKCKSVAQIEEEEAVKKFTEDYRVKKAKQQIEESLKAQDRHTSVFADSVKSSDSEAASTDEVNREYVDMQIEIAQEAHKKRVAKYDKITSVPSRCEGTACLIRVKDTIRISYRKGKQADYSSPNRVCISNYYKQLFFNEVKKVRGTDTEIWCLKSEDAAYNWWNRFIDDTYQAQRKNYIEKLILEEKK